MKETNNLFYCIKICLQDPGSKDDVVHDWEKCDASLAVNSSVLEDYGVSMSKTDLMMKAKKAEDELKFSKERLLDVSDELKTFKKHLSDVEGENRGLKENLEKVASEKSQIQASIRDFVEKLEQKEREVIALQQEMST